MDEYFETSLDKLNRNYRHKIVNIIVSPTVFGYMEPSGIPSFATGFFLEADELGIYILTTCEARKGKKDLFYHDKIIKIEEVGQIDLDSLPKIQKEILEQSSKKYEQDRKEQIKKEFEEIENKPDVIDPTDHEGIMNRLQEVQKMIIDNKQKENEDFLEKR